MRDLVQKLIAQVDGAGFTDNNGHSLEMNEAYLNLKAVVERDPTGHYYADPDSPADGELARLREDVALVIAHDSNLIDHLRGWR